MIEIFIIFVLACIIAALVFFIMRLANKIEFYENWIIAFKHRVDYAAEKIKAIDIRGSFEADDEVGFVYHDIKNLVNDLNSFVEEDTDIGK